MIKISLSISFVLIVLNSLAQVSNYQEEHVKETSILTINNEKISLEEFENVFYKNNHNSEITKEYLDEYMELFINFKIKVQEAKELQMDTVSTFINELKGYEEQLAKPYLTNKEFDENMIIEAYNRMLQDIKASHILISLSEKATEEEKNKAYDKAISIRNDIINKKLTFGEAAIRYSDDKSASLNQGSLGYFTAFMMVYEFENAAYNTKLDELSMPVRTKYGFHIIQINDKRKAVGQVQVSHIMFKYREGEEEKKFLQAKDKISEIYEKLNLGEDFAELAERFSEDRSTAVKGGVLPSFGVGKMVPEFEEIAFSLNNIGDISKPFATKFGWHIIKLLDRKEIMSFDDLKPELRKKIARDTRSRLSQEALFKKLRNEYKISHNPKLFSSLRRVAFKNVEQGNWDGFYEFNDDILFYIDDYSVSISLFIKYILSNQNKESNFDEMYQNFIDESLLLYEKSQLAEKYPEYRNLLNEYRDGILLFDLTNKKVWKKAVEDTLGLDLFFKKNIDQYRWEERLQATIYNCIDLQTARKIKSHLFKKRIGVKVLENNSLLESMNEKNPLSLQLEEAKFSRGDNEFIDRIDWKTGIASDIKMDDGSFIIIDVAKIIPESNKELNETRGKVISEYQNHLEQEWIMELREKYNININKDILYSLIK